MTIMLDRKGHSHLKKVVSYAEFLFYVGNYAEIPKNQQCMANKETYP